MESVRPTVASVRPVKSEDALLERARRCSRYSSLAELTEETLRQIAAVEGVDFATALLYDRIRHGPEHGPALDRLFALPHDLPPPSNERMTVVIVPGGFYVRRPDTGADGQFLMDEFASAGYRAERIPLHSFGRLMTNARIILAWLEAHADGPVILVSLSKGGAEVKLALTQPGADAAFRNVIAWVSLSGLPSGTPLVSRILASKPLSLLGRLLFWWRGYDFTALADLERGSRGLLDFEVQLPGHLQAVHVAGFPLRAHLSCRMARKNFRRLVPLGPNDSNSLLADLCREPGLIVPIWGADHFLRPACDVPRLMARLLHFLTEHRTVLGVGMMGK